MLPISYVNVFQKKKTNKNIQENLNRKIDIKVSNCQISEKWKPIRVREG